MCFFPVLFWCSAVVDDAEVRTVFAAIPRFGGRASPVRFSTGIRVQRLDFRNHFCSQQRLRGGIRRNSRFDGKNRQFLPANCSADWRRALKAIEGNRNSSFPCCVPALGCARHGRGGEAAQAVRRLVRVAPHFPPRLAVCRRGAPPIRPRRAAGGASARVTAIGAHWAAPLF